MTEKEYKDLSVKEFTKAAQTYGTDRAGIYEMCKDDYPDILEELEKEPWDTLLDAGCGPAPMISLLAEKYPERQVDSAGLYKQRLCPLAVQPYRNTACAFMRTRRCGNAERERDSGILRKSWAYGGAL